MTPSALLGATARAASRTALGRSAALSVSRGAARLVSRWFSGVPGVESVYLTGSLTRPERFEPGRSDIDLVLVCDFASPARADLPIVLRERQTSLSALGGLFYNLDCLDVEELPYARAFGGTWEMRFDAQAQRVAGRSLFSGRAKRPISEVRNENLGTALRRWFNTGARLLDPTLEIEIDAARDAQRLFADVAELWSGIDVRTDAGSLLARVKSAPGLPSAREALGLGLDACRGSSVRDIFLPATLEMLDAFAHEITRDFRGELDTTGNVQRLEPLAGFREFGAMLLGAPFESVALIDKAPRASEYFVLAVAATDAPAQEVVREAVARGRRAADALRALRRWCRRPAPITEHIWSALSLAEPAPFVGAAASRPLVRLGAPLGAPLAPSHDALLALLRARVVQSFTLCRGPELRPRMAAEHRRRALASRFVLLPALDRAIDTGKLDVTWEGFHDADPPPAGERERLLGDFSRRHRARLAPLLDERIGASWVDFDVPGRR